MTDNNDNQIDPNFATPVRRRTLPEIFASPVLRTSREPCALQPYSPINDPGNRTRFFHVRISDPSPEVIANIKSLCGTIFTELIIGATEVGNQSGVRHQHFFIRTLDQFRLTTFRKMMEKKIREFRDMIWGKDYWFGLSCHIVNPDKSVQDAINYVIKHGMVYHYPGKDDVPLVPPIYKGDGGPAVKRNKVDNSKYASRDLTKYPKYMPEKDDELSQFTGIPREDRYALAIKYLRDIGEDHDHSPPIQLYERVHCVYGENAGKALFPEIYHLPQGNNVRKQFPSAVSTVRFPEPSDIEILFITGYAGRGKSAMMNLLYPGHYVKNKTTPYWEKYNFYDHSTDNPHMCVVFNELDTPHDLLSFSTNKSSFDAIKNMCDIYPFPVEIKHKAQEMIRPRRIFITSNTDLDTLIKTINGLKYVQTPNNYFYGMDTGVLSAALKRRMKTIDIEELLETYQCKTFPWDPVIRFGGVFHKSVLDDLKKDMVSIASDENITVAKTHELMGELIAKYTKLSQDALKKYRWVPYDTILHTTDSKQYKEKLKFLLQQL